MIIRGNLENEIQLTEYMLISCADSQVDK